MCIKKFLPKNLKMLKKPWNETIKEKLQDELTSFEESTRKTEIPEMKFLFLLKIKTVDYLEFEERLSTVFIFLYKLFISYCSSSRSLISLFISSISFRCASIILSASSCTRGSEMLARSLVRIAME